MASNTVLSADPRSDIEKAAHRTMALENLKKMNDLVAKAARESGVAPPAIPETPYEYSCQISVGGLIFFAVSMDFSGSNVTYSGLGGGLAIGVATTWGTAYFNYSLSELATWDSGPFELNYGAVAVNLNLFGPDQQGIGTCVAGGVGIGAGIVGGKGSFSD